MYFVWLFLVAFLLIFFFCTNWPVRLYHNYYLTKLAAGLGSIVQNRRPSIMGPAPEVNTIYRGRPIKIRFVEGSVDSLRSNSGLEIRMEIESQAVMEFNHLSGRRRERGEFIRFQTGDPEIDANWFIVTTDPTTAASFWQKYNLKELLTVNRRNIEQLSINRSEMIVRLKKKSISQVVELVGRLVGLTGCG